VNLVPARTGDDIETARALFRDYQRFLGVDLCFQGFAEESEGHPFRPAP